MGDIVLFRQDRGVERLWVPKAEEAYWIAFWGKGGTPAARWKDYVRWGGFYPPAIGDHRIGGSKVLRRTRRKRTNYARWTPPE